MYPIRGKAGSGHVEHQIVLYIRVLYYVWIACNCLSRPRLCDEYAETPAETQSHLGLLKRKRLFFAQIIISDDQAPMDVCFGIGRVRPPDQPALADQPPRLP